jgi:hypothetical protein
MKLEDAKRRLADFAARRYSPCQLKEGLAMVVTRKLGYLVVPVLVATAFQMLSAGEPAADPRTVKSPHASTAKPTGKATAKPASLGASSKSPVTISLSSTMRDGNLVVVLDDVPVFNEQFHKPALLISQTTTWDPLQLAPGKHRLSAKVYGTKKTYFSATYELELSRTKGSALRFLMKGDKLTVDVTS